MNFWTALVVIVAILAFARVRTARLHAERGIVHDNAGNQSLIGHSSEAELRREVEDLRKRLEVLERITTDERRTDALNREIENLRSN